ncbi:hypothetical protein [Phaffia rhodozyma]|uniref:Uncharacterized protein n=1 Tax=Phaffia rhodozyma TaxID=264483 RepID=A0A0F7SUL5_PHARH|nr:hypothetical protein [Phaffia rhodozyma]
MSSSAQASSTRQRNSSSLLAGQDSDGVDHTTDAPQGKRIKQQPVTSFTSKLILVAIAVTSFYAWRFSVQSAEVGGWWNLITGHRPVNTPIAAQKAAASAAALQHFSTGSAGSDSRAPSGQIGVEDQIIRLADSLGVKPRQLTEAIAPLLQPALLSKTDSAIHNDKTPEEIAAEEAAQASAAETAAHAAGGVLGGVGTILDALAD